MYSRNYIIPNNSSYMYRNGQNNGDRFFLAPFIAGGLAGTALGFGIANNNQINNGNFGGFYPAPMPIFPVYPTPYCTNCPNQQPTYTTSNNYYY